jgi:hypothetical protein
VEFPLPTCFMRFLPAFCFPEACAYDNVTAMYLANTFARR